MTWSHHHTQALIHQERGEPFLAKTHARRARSHATTPGQAAESELVLAWICQQQGDHIAATGLIASARPNLPEHLRARADCLTGLAHCMKAEHLEAVAILTKAAVALDPHWKANALVGIGVSAGYLRRFATSNKALDEARALYLRLCKTERAATCLHNKGFVAAQAGDYERALVLYAEAGIDETRRPEVLIDKANALLGIGRTSDAGRALARAAKLLGAAGRGPDFAEATLAHAKCALRVGDHAGAAASADTAAELFRAQGRPGWADRAEAIKFRAIGLPSPRVAATCERIGWHAEAAELHLLAGRPDLVEAHRASPSKELRALGWLAKAQTATGRRGVLAACRAGLRLPAGEPRLAEVGLATALAGGNARTVFSWVERGRSAMITSELVAETLGDRAMINLFVHKGQMLAVVCAGKRFRVLDVAPAAQIAESAQALRRGCALASRLGRDGLGASPLEAVLAGAMRVVGDRDLVVVGGQEVLWPALPSCVGRPVSVVPSAEAWVRACGVESRVGAVWVEGPELAHASREIVDLQARYGGAALTGEAATVEAASRAMAQVGMVHIAAHGRQGPALALADGLLRPSYFGEPAPERIVLAACDSAGFAEPLLARGSASVIASAIPVPDERTGALMRALHASMAKGPAQALAEAQAQHGHLGFLCFGA
ncbi:CHAT domain-containing protein [Actinokineospora sp. HUAS TT18]|uniref:CHAT domain-containing protein n=1 Tax=Actinokineospora sp. HUAS TT18 TaxID=3447451 RepID=UPI003F51C1EE